MSASYRLINFRPNPASDTCFTLGAVVSWNGAVKIVRARHVPGVDCLGDEKLGVAVSRLIRRFELIESAQTLPQVFGPYTELGDPRPVPSGVRSPPNWVESVIGGVARPGPAHGIRGANRSTVGRRLLASMGVEKHVQRTFKPATSWGGWLREYESVLPTLSHWVEGEHELLLMEPIVPDRPGVNDDLRTIATGFMAYRGAIAEIANGRRARLLAYVTTGGTREQRSVAMEALHKAAHEMVDTNIPYQRDLLVSRIEETASRGNAQLTLVE